MQCKITPDFVYLKLGKAMFETVTENMSRSTDRQPLAVFTSIFAGAFLFLFLAKDKFYSDFHSGSDLLWLEKKNRNKNFFTQRLSLTVKNH